MMMKNVGERHLWRLDNVRNNGSKAKEYGYAGAFNYSLDAAEDQTPNGDMRDSIILNQKRVGVRDNGLANGETEK